MGEREWVYVYIGGGGGKRRCLCLCEEGRGLGSDQIRRYGTVLNETHVKKYTMRGIRICPSVSHP